MKLIVSIEINGIQKEIGSIIGYTSDDACFSYSKNYLSNGDAYAISINLPLKDEPFSSGETRAFFEGLLPESSARKAAFEWLNIDEDNYLYLLKSLGTECLGTVRVFDNQDDKICKSAYEKIPNDDLISLACGGKSKAAEFAFRSHSALAGTTGKIGLYLQDGTWYLPKGDACSTHIIKQGRTRFKNIVVNELLCQKAAGELGICVPDCFIIRPDTYDSETLLFASKRFDRSFGCDFERGSADDLKQYEIADGCFGQDKKTADDLKVPIRLHQEDFAQALGIPSSEKYEKSEAQHYLKRMFELVRTYSSNPSEDQMLLWDRIVFYYLIGNTDCHVKNSSLVYSKDLKSIRLAPCYDTVCTTMYGNETRSMAFNIAGKYDIKEIGRSDFEIAARECGLCETDAMEHFDRSRDGIAPALKSAAEQLAEDGFAAAKEVCDLICCSRGL